MSVAGTRSSSGQAEPAWVGEVLHYWFEEVAEAHWFKANHDLDAQIRARFIALHERAATGHVPGITTPRALLAAVIVLDQFSRNIFRGTPRAYAADPAARRHASTAIDQGYDLNMAIPHRQFLYMPFQHSEEREDQARSVALFEKLGDKILTEYALAHKAIIDRFGRFPHRNAALNRQSSAEEIALLKEPMGSF